jgi:hypothetical protein
LLVFNVGMEHVCNWKTALCIIVLTIAFISLFNLSRRELFYRWSSCLEARLDDNYSRGYQKYIEKDYMAIRESGLSCKWFSPSDPINADILTNGRCVHPELKKFNLIISGRDWCNLFDEISTEQIDQMQEKAIQSEQ